jgi:hypothetical protein
VTALSAQQLLELADGEARVGDDPPHRSLSDLAMVGHDDTCIWLAAAQDHMAAGLAAKLEAGALQSRADLPPRQTGGELGHDSGEISHSRLRGLHLHEFRSGLGRDWITGFPAVF